MAAPHTNPAIPVPIPLRGYNARDPLSAMSPEYSPWIVNFEPEARYLKARTSFKVHCQLTSETSCYGLASHNDELFAYCKNASTNNRIYDITDGSSPSVVHTTGSPNAVSVSTIQHAGRTYFCTTSDFANTARYYDGSSWSSYGFVDSGATSRGSRVNASFKGRFYIFTSSSAYYSDTVPGVTGSTTTWAIYDLFQTPGVIRWSKTLSSSALRAAEQYMAVGNASGEILVFAGSYPDSSDWELIGRFFTSPPLFWNCALEYQNDIWVLTTTGVRSVRKLFEFGSDNSDAISVSGTVDPYWNNLIDAIVRLNATQQLASNAALVFWPEVNKIWAMIHGTVDETGSFATFSSSGTTFFVYNPYSQAWVPQQSTTLSQGSGTDPHSLHYFNNAFYFVVGNTVMVYDGLDYLGDEDSDNPGTFSAYSVECQSAYQSFGIANKHKKLNTIEPIIRTTSNASWLNVKSAADFGRSESNNSTKTLRTSGANYTGYHFPSYHAGARGAFLQWVLSGNVPVSDPDVALELYSMGVSVG